MLPGYHYCREQTVGAELGQYLMRFSLMEGYLERAEVIAFLADLGSALDGFVRGMEQFVALRQGVLREHALLAVEPSRTASPQPIDPLTSTRPARPTGRPH